LRLEGDPARQELSESDVRSISDRISMVMSGHWETRLPPTQTQRRDLAAAETGLTQLERDLNALMLGGLARLAQAFSAAGAPLDAWKADGAVEAVKSIQPRATHAAMQ
jgi:hypothetical protein